MFFIRYSLASSACQVDRCRLLNVSVASNADTHQTHIRIRVQIVSVFSLTLTVDFQGGASFVDHLCVCHLLLCFHARLFVDALWSPAGKGLTSWLSFVISYCDVVTFPLVSWVRCGA